MYSKFNKDATKTHQQLYINLIYRFLHASYTMHWNTVMVEAPIRPFAGSKNNATWGSNCIPKPPKTTSKSPLQNVARKSYLFTRILQARSQIFHGKGAMAQDALQRSGRAVMKSKETIVLSKCL